MEQLLAIFRAVGDPSRLRILLLARGMELAVGEIAQVLQQSQPRVSRHLRILAECGLVERVREGAWVFVRLGPAAISGPALAAIDALADALADGLVGGGDLGAGDRARLAVVRADRAAAVDSWFAAHAGEWQQERALHSSEAAVEAAIRAALGPGDLGELVDVGTGTGRMIELLVGQATSVLGLDRNPEMLRIARNRLEAAGLTGARVQSADMYQLPLAAAACDTLLLHQVLHYADDPAAVIGEAARVLRAHGRLLVVDLMPHTREELRVERRHLRLGFADETVLGWMENSGLNGAVAQQLPAAGDDKLGVTIWLAQKPAVKVNG
ncbi:metalloregulator ArsR/SmtB family transcription factor [Sandarakinorhabdus sp.]|uniref:ArsR/SmtB family transcription factor n=1 Tax=Sandarakinorhabdus sp. TaxID=1916663 RepID=UPI00286DE44C|nr:metalloregulator ArsR/SmtB family transcription factor [Sandarakinorhabdus sp.]